MFERLEKHHLGFIVSQEEMIQLEKIHNREFTYDSTQETHVLFVFDKYIKMYYEFICQEGRVKNNKLGFAHICYNVENMELRTVM